MHTKIYSHVELYTEPSPAFTGILKAMDSVHCEKDRDAFYFGAGIKYLNGLYQAFRAERYEDIIASLDEQDSAALADLARDELVFHGEKLLYVPRAGWVKRGITPCENVADHSYGAVRLFQYCDEHIEFIGYDKKKIVQMLFVHDIAEGVTDDLIDEEGSSCRNITTDEKKRLEKEAILRIFRDRPMHLSLWDEYEQRVTKEAVLAKQIDQLEAVLQASWYVRSGRAPVSVLKEFVQTSRKYLKDHTQFLRLSEFVLQYL